MTSSSPKVAIFYDWLNHSYGGAEKVLLDILKIFPSSDLFTLVYDPHRTSWLPSTTKVITSPINYLPGAKSNPIFYTPFYSLALASFDFSKYDAVISTTSTIGHQLPVSSKQLFICYFHNINRYLYFTPKKYQLLQPLLKIYQRFDQHFIKPSQYLLCNSATVQARIAKYYHHPATIVYPGIDTTVFTPISRPQANYFLIVSRLVPHKNIDLAIKACQQINFPLKIVGVGRQARQLQSISNSSTEFLGNLNQPQLVKLYQNCLCLLHPQEEDFGLSCLEAQACGRPVIALSRGGATETVLDGQTGLFFHQPTVKSLSLALKKFSHFHHNPHLCRQNALKFSRQHFVLNFTNTFDTLWQVHTS